jgi:alkanesulfonate monooxygenase SsuD/methylene tetrahydromethanopterin reductase-like flavin-dependent oxidoreductase (luciferase family)
MKDVPEERVREFLISGTPEEVTRQVESFREAGIEYFIVNLEPRNELEALELFGREIVQKF